MISFSSTTHECPTCHHVRSIPTLVGRWLIPVKRLNRQQLLKMTLSETMAYFGVEGPNRRTADRTTADIVPFLEESEFTEVAQ